MRKAVRKGIGEEILKLADQDRDIVIITSDARGSASIVDFPKLFPERFVEVGIAEQSAVGIAAGLALSGKKPFIFGPACFYSARSLEQIKNDIAYTNANVKIIAVSGGVSYGALGSTHHSLHDIAAMRAIPNINVILPCDVTEAVLLLKSLVNEKTPAYMRIGRNPVPVIYKEEREFRVGKAITLMNGSDVTIIATGELVWNALKAGQELEKEGIKARVIDSHTVKPLDEKTILKAARETGRIITVEEHSVFGGLGGAVSEFVSQNCPALMKILGIPDEYPVTGNQGEVYKHYDLDAEGIYRAALEMLGKT